MTRSDWFAADKDGLSRLMGRRGIAWALYEVVQNGLDQDVSRVDVRLCPIPGVPQAWLTCEDDDPNGFENLALAWTLFADTGKRSDPTKAGRFTMGEKMVLALALEAKIATTTGTVIFDGDGRRTSRAKREIGSRVEVRLPMTRAELDEVSVAAGRIIPRPGVVLTFNGERIPERKAVASFECRLQTEFADEDKVLRRTYRNTTVELHHPLPGEEAMLYELGLPVAPLEDVPWHVNVKQRVPLNMDRDNVTPAYRRMVLTAVVNLMHEELPKDAASSPWVGEALTSPDIAPEAVESVLTARYGDKRVIADPSDPEGTKLAMSKGYQVIQAGSFSREQWANIRSSGAALPAGQVTPSPKVWSDDPNAPMAERIERHKWTASMVAVAAYVEAVGARLVRPGIQVEFYSTSNPFSAAFGGLTFQFNVKRLGRGYFERALGAGFDDLNRLVIHELGHYYSSDHLSERYHDALCNLGAKLARLALDCPDFFREHLDPPVGPG